MTLTTTGKWVVGGVAVGSAAALAYFGVKKFKNNAAKKLADQVAKAKKEAKDELTKKAAQEATKEAFDASHIDVMEKMPGETAKAFQERMDQLIAQADEAKAKAKAEDAKKGNKSA